MDVKKQIVFIVNPKSGLLDKQQILNWIEKRLNQDLFEPTFFHTEYAGHASELQLGEMEPLMKLPVLLFTPKRH